ncbi:carboxymuconolactone decarboxylase family protein [Virgisporangium ochraceum]|uniref:Carboxymuconolactone decarboxylase-like domain-containing protein n=1 Tax=Virgisporangium ochraceum TaxID=65505 RepID=A0A8J4A1A0_9ACTN|nr:carboxymuconolactone decarboxylase family protein [Virgisporangium ochraceum]GIJ73984.1 hypothetical protein Voc01_089010 [Virgisporangium ochraceum]
MTRRYAITELPDAYRALSGVEAYAREHVDKQLLHLVKLRASLLNGCAFCLDMHTGEALKHGEDVRRLMALGAWREAPFFDAGERAALALTDEVTRLGEHGVSDETWDAAVEHWGREGAVNLVVAIGMINLWNRISVTARAQPPV